MVDGASAQIVLGVGDDFSVDTGANGGNIDIEPRIIGTDGEGDSVIRLDAGSGTLTLDNTTGDLISTDIGNVTLIGSTITLSNDIVSDTGNIDIDGAVVLKNSGGTITVSTLTGSGGTIDFDSTINATSASGTKENLTIVSGSGTVNVGGIIGGSTAIKDLTISSNTTDTGAVTLTGIGSAADSVGAATVAIGNNAGGGKQLASITFDGDFYTTSGTQTYTADSYPINGTNTAFTASGLSLIHI